MWPNSICGSRWQNYLNPSVQLLCTRLSTSQDCSERLWRKFNPTVTREISMKKHFLWACKGDFLVHMCTIAMDHGNCGTGIQTTIQQPPSILQGPHHVKIHSLLGKKKGNKIGSLTRSVQRILHPLFCDPKERRRSLSNTGSVTLNKHFMLTLHQVMQGGLWGAGLHQWT